MKNFNHNLAIEVLQMSNDGDDLSSKDLAVTELAVNNNLSEQGEVYLIQMHTKLKKGTYARSWFHGVEHVTQDPEGYVYWKDKQIEHFSYSDGKEEAEATRKFAERMLLLEKQGIELTVRNYLNSI
tara:strand:+ start:377 stop:754 length:378 start_codon:yes stop_codon:yes gene_type:complete